MQRRQGKEKKLVKTAICEGKSAHKSFFPLCLFAVFGGRRMFCGDIHKIFYVPSLFLRRDNLAGFDHDPDNPESTKRIY